MNQGFTLRNILVIFSLVCCSVWRCSIFIYDSPMKLSLLIVFWFLRFKVTIVLPCSKWRCFKTKWTILVFDNFIFSVHLSLYYYVMLPIIASDTMPEVLYRYSLFWALYLYWYVCLLSNSQINFTILHYKNIFLNYWLLLYLTPLVFPLVSNLPWLLATLALYLISNSFLLFVTLDRLVPSFFLRFVCLLFCPQSETPAVTSWK